MPATDADPRQMPRPIPVFSRRLGSWRVSVSRDPLSDRDLVARYNRAAASWDRGLSRIGAPDDYARLLSEVLRHLPDRRRGARALDCGTGSGALLRALHGVAPGAFRQEAVDLSPAMCRAAQDALACHGCAVAVHRADIRRLPFDSGRFDLTMSAHVCEHLPDPHEAIAEMVRVTRPGGLVFVCMSRRAVWGRWIQFRWRTHLMSRAEGVALMAAAGLADVRPLVPVGATALSRRSVACIGRVPGG